MRREFGTKDSDNNKYSEDIGSLDAVESGNASLLPLEEKEVSVRKSYGAMTLSITIACSHFTPVPSFMTLKYRDFAPNDSFLSSLLASLFQCSRPVHSRFLPLSFSRDYWLQTPVCSVHGGLHMLIGGSTFPEAFPPR